MIGIFSLALLMWMGQQHKEWVIGCAGVTISGDATVQGATNCHKVPSYWYCPENPRVAQHADSVCPSGHYAQPRPYDERSPDRIVVRTGPAGGTVEYHENGRVWCDDGTLDPKTGHCVPLGPMVLMNPRLQLDPLETGHHICSANRSHDCLFDENGAHDYDMLPDGSWKITGLAQPENPSAAAEREANWLAHIPKFGPIGTKPPDPVDVPAIQELKRSDSAIYVTTNTAPGVICSWGYHKRWTCADKSRILIVSEDGKHWCHKVQE